MIPIFYSRYTPGLKNGEHVQFSKGETVRYRFRNGQEMDITIDSNYRQHSPSGMFGYEAIFSDNGERSFAAAQGIINWEGKCR